MSVLAVIILFIIFVSVLFNAYRDSWVHRKPEIGWWRWHLVKWVSFFSPLIHLSYFYFRVGGLTHLAIAVFLIFAAICYVVWRMIYSEIS